MNIRQYLMAMRDSDAITAADLLDKPIQLLNIDSGCGATCKAVADAALAYSTAIDGAGWESPESRWEVWSQSVRAMQIHYFG